MKTIFLLVVMVGCSGFQFDPSNMHSVQDPVPVFNTATGHTTYLYRQDENTYYTSDASFNTTTELGE